MIQETKYYTPGEVAQIFHVRIQTIYSWVKDGAIDSFRTPGGKIRIAQASVDKMFQHGQP